MSRKDKSFIIYSFMVVLFFGLAIAEKAMGNNDKSQLLGWVGVCMLIIVFCNIWNTKEKK